MKDEEWNLLDRQVLGVIWLTISRSVAHNVVKENTTIVSELGWFSGWLFVWIKMEEKGLLWLRWSYSKRKGGLLD